MTGRRTLFHTDDTGGCMKNWLGQVDGLLRARQGRGDGLGDGSAGEGLGGLSARRIAGLMLGLGGAYGFFMGWYALRSQGAGGLLQLCASTAKLPLLFAGTLAVTFPSLYVFGTLAGSEMDLRRQMRAVSEWIVVMLAVAASLGPILGFFTLSTDSYAFIVLLNVLFLGIAGVSGVAALARRVRATPSNDGLPVKARAGSVLVLWIVLFGLVGMQMAWVLRPFIGAPDTPFALFRPTESNAFAAVLRTLGRLLGVQ